MKFVRFNNEGTPACAVVEGDNLQEIKGDIFSEYEILHTNISLHAVKLLPPCVPSKIIAIGLNYRSHAQELSMKIPEEPLLFMKPSTAVIGPMEPIRYPAMSRRIDYEGELGVVIGKSCRCVSIEDAPRYVLGYTCFNDVTARDLQKRDGQFTRSKSFDSFAPIGPYIETDLDPHNVLVETVLNGEKRQSAFTSDLIFPVYYLVSFISHVMTLWPGDVIATGTPSGIGPMQVGDVVEVIIEGIGTLKNRVVKEAP